MASVTDVFSEKERTNWLKAWLAVHIAKTGLEQFVDKEASKIHDNIYKAVWFGGQCTALCTSCDYANLIQCPTEGQCNKNGENSCTNMHNTPTKKPRPCPFNVCETVLAEIEKKHRYKKISWKNTLTQKWGSHYWEIAKCYFPEDGYDKIHSVQDTDFNGVVSFMLNCTHFENKFTFNISRGKKQPACLLTKARDIGKELRHSAQFKVTDRDLQDIFTTLTGLLTDERCLAKDGSAQDAMEKLQKLSKDDLNMQEVMHFQMALLDALMKVEPALAAAVNEIQLHIANCRVPLNKQYTDKCKDAPDEHRRTVGESNYEESCEDLRRRLVEHYSDTYSHVPLSTLDQSFDKRLKDIYATPKIHRIHIERKGKRAKREQVLTYTNIFYNNETLNRRIYIQGEPGTGKSTFAAKLVHDWCNLHAPSSAVSNNNTAFADVVTIGKFDFLFFISLRESGGQKEVTEMIKTQLIDKKYSEYERDGVYKLFEQIMKKAACFIVRDGLDEWVAPAGCNLAEPSMAGFPNDKCTVLTTSRPWKLADERIKNSQIDILLEIEGVSDPDTLIERILGCLIDNDLKEKVKRFNESIYSRDLKSLSSSPMLYSLVVCTWVDDIDKIKEGGHLTGSSLCALYTTLLESLCKKTSSTTGHFTDSNPPRVKCFSDSSYLLPNIDNLDKLSEAACKLMFSSERETSIVFNDKTLSNYFSSEEFAVRKEFALKTGLLSNRKDKTRTGSWNSFIHKSVQEFLAAYHIACNTQVIDDVISVYIKRHDDAYLDISQMFIFLCGLNISAANKLSNRMNECDVDQGHRRQFQDIIWSGYREAVANEQTGILLKLSHFYIHGDNIRDMHSIWTLNTSNVQLLCVNASANSSALEIQSSPASGESASRIEFDLSACHKLKSLELCYAWIGFRDIASSATSDCPVRVLLNSADPARCADSPPVLPSIEHIALMNVTCSSSWVRSLFNTQLTLGHQVECALENCDITSCVEGKTRTSAYITTSLNNTFKIYVHVDSPGLWKALRDLNIKSLSLSDDDDRNSEILRHTSLLAQSLASLKQLETLCMFVFYVSPGMLEALCGLNIKQLSLGIGDRYSHLESLSQSLLSLTQLETITMYLCRYIDVQLPRSLKVLNLYCKTMQPSELRNLVNKLPARTGTVACRLEFCCGVYFKLWGNEIRKIPAEIYIPILEAPEHEVVKRFRIHAAHERDIVGDDDDVVADKLYEQYLQYVNEKELKRISLRQIKGPQSPASTS